MKRTFRPDGPEAKGAWGELQTGLGKGENTRGEKARTIRVVGNMDRSVLIELTCARPRKPAVLMGEVGAGAQRAAAIVEDELSGALLIIHEALDAGQ